MTNREALYNTNNKKMKAGRDLHKVWARVGMSGYLTKEELELLNKEKKTNEDLEKEQDLFSKYFYMDGETYFPQEDEGNEKYINKNIWS